MVYNHQLKVYNMLTENEKIVLRFLMAAFGKEHSINQIARECSVTPNGAYKILAKLEKEGVLMSKKIANIKSYIINFEGPKTQNVLEFALIPDLNGSLKHRADDLTKVHDAANACVIFGSYLHKQSPNDLDALFVVEKENYKKYRQLLKEVIAPVRIHDIAQTEKDLSRNIEKRDEIITSILRKGVVLWGQSVIVEALKNANKEKA